MISVEPLKEATEAAAHELAQLGSMLHDDTRTMTVQQLQNIVADKNIVLMVVKDDGRVVGMGTLYLIPKIGKTNAYLEDVIVSDQYRGQGLGEKLTRAIIESAREREVGSISLTSSPSRVAAHKLYEKVGFKIKETNVFKLSLK
jgi:ribosomal protein S18 acetylase RimI-like enzyme